MRTILSVFMAGAVTCIFSTNAVAETISLKVMTFNIKNGSDRVNNTWLERRPLVKHVIQTSKPDLVGTQEGFYFQIRDMDDDLPDYDWIGLGRAGGSKDEFMAIFYKADRLRLEAYDHFWLSDTPEVVGSRTWGHDNRRMVTWARFEDLESGVEFYHWNTHFDHRVEEARQKSADLIRKRILETEPRRPTVVTGDFNTPQGGVVHSKFLGPSNDGLKLSDVWEMTDNHIGDQVQTFNGWRDSFTGDRRIDWILVTPEFKAKSAEVITYTKDGQFPSDHFPVVAELELTVE